MIRFAVFSLSLLIIYSILAYSMGYQSIFLFNFISRVYSYDQNFSYHSLKLLISESFTDFINIMATGRPFKILLSWPSIYIYNFFSSPNLILSLL